MSRYFPPPPSKKRIRVHLPPGVDYPTIEKRPPLEPLPAGDRDPKHWDRYVALFFAGLILGCLFALIAVNYLGSLPR